MTRFVIERELAERVELSPELVDGAAAYSADTMLRRLLSLLSADRKKSRCPNQAPSAESLRRPAEDTGLPADVVVEANVADLQLFTIGASVSGSATTWATSNDPAGSPRSGGRAVPGRGTRRRRTLTSTARPRQRRPQPTKAFSEKSNTCSHDVVAYRHGRGGPPEICRSARGARSRPGRRL